jgi:large subunit ribosomal protein L15
MNLNEIKPGSTGVKNSKRIGRGPGSGKGKTCGRGQKGAGARKSPNKGRVAFEGGQMPLQRRLPKRGFKSHFVKDTQVVNLKSLEAADINGVVDAVVLAEFGLVKSSSKPVKILGFGTLTKALELKVNAVSAQAKAAVEAAGGKIELI